ncbi:hypothetical protein [Pseudomonas viridiflava]|uniref:hypothetical protein n=1 Tax=Pseudomonas viridiflava TaxID=33069 RepID=UPI002EAFB636|nr:hypothetical protein [Pseudomonas viridiflava]
MKTLTQSTEGRRSLQCGEASCWSTILKAVNDASNVALLSHLDSLLEDDVLMAEAARRSHRHQLGFLKIVLLAEGAGPSLRVHVWDQKASSLEDIHSHCAIFSSRVVAGGLTENLYGLSLGANYARFRYRFDPGMKCSVAAADGLTSVSLLERNIRLSGDVYTRGPDELHNVTDVLTGTITISAWQSRNAEALVLKSDKASSPQDCSTQIGMPEAELRLVICNIKEKVLGYDTQ